MKGAPPDLANVPGQRWFCFYCKYHQRQGEDAYLCDLRVQPKNVQPCSRIRTREGLRLTQ